MGAKAASFEVNSKDLRKAQEGTSNLTHAKTKMYWHHDNAIGCAHIAIICVNSSRTSLNFY